MSEDRNSKLDSKDVFVLPATKRLMSEDILDVRKKIRSVSIIPNIQVPGL
jgi:hypothetical protein